MSESWETKAKSTGTKEKGMMGGEGEMLSGNWGISFYGWKVWVRGRGGIRYAYSRGAVLCRPSCPRRIQLHSVVNGWIWKHSRKSSELILQSNKPRPRRRWCKCVTFGNTLILVSKLSSALDQLHVFESLSEALWTSIPFLSEWENTQLRVVLGIRFFWAPVKRSLLLLGPPSQASIHHTSIFWKRVILKLSQKTRGTHSQNFTYPLSWSSSLVVFHPWWGNKPIPNKPKIIKTAEQKWVLHETMHVSWDRGWSCFVFFSLNTKPSLASWFPRDYNNYDPDYRYSSHLNMPNIFHNLSIGNKTDESQSVLARQRCQVDSEALKQ